MLCLDVTFLESNTCFPFSLYFSCRYTLHYLARIKVLCRMASSQRACRAKWLWCLHVCSGTGRNTHTPLAFRPGWRWNKEHIAGGGPPEQKKKEKMLKNMMQASLTYWVALCVCVYAALRLAKKPARLQLFCFLSRPHTSWAVAFVVWVYEDFYIFFLSPSYCRVLSKGGSTHETAVWLPSNQDVEHFAFHNLSSLKPMKQCSQPGT